MVITVGEFAERILDRIREVAMEPAYQHEDEDWLTGLIIAQGIIQDELLDILESH